MCEAWSETPEEEELKNSGEKERKESPQTVMKTKGISPRL